MNNPSQKQADQRSDGGLSSSLSTRKHEAALRLNGQFNRKSQIIDKQLASLGEQVRSQDGQIKKLQRQMQTRITDNIFLQILGLVCSAVQLDPSLTKLLKSKQNLVQEKDKLKQTANLLGKKVNQLGEGQMLLLSMIRKLQAKIIFLQADLPLQLNQKTNAIQANLDQFKNDYAKDSLQMQQKVQQTTFQIGDKIRDLQTKTTWKLNEFKTKLDEKVNEQYLNMLILDSNKKQQQKIKQYQLSCAIDPARVQALQKQVPINRAQSNRQITDCLLKLNQLKKQIEQKSLPIITYQQQKIQIQKRMQFMNIHLTQLIQRLRSCQNKTNYNQNISSQLNNKNHQFQKQLKRISVVLNNMNVGQDFQKMLQKMNPEQILQLSKKIDDVAKDQQFAFRNYKDLKRCVDSLQSKTDIKGIKSPNQPKQQIKNQQLQKIISEILLDHQFMQKISNIQRQVRQQKQTVESINNLSKQVARLTKQSDTHTLHMRLQTLEQQIKAQFLIMRNSRKQSLNSAREDNNIKQVIRNNSLRTIKMRSTVYQSSRNNSKQGIRVNINRELNQISTFKL